MIEQIGLPSEVAALIGVRHDLNNQCDCGWAHVLFRYESGGAETLSLRRGDEEAELTVKPVAMKDDWGRPLYGAAVVESTGVLSYAPPVTYPEPPERPDLGPDVFVKDGWVWERLWWLNWPSKFEEEPPPWARYPSKSGWLHKEIKIGEIPEGWTGVAALQYTGTLSEVLFLDTVEEAEALQEVGVKTNWFRIVGWVTVD